MNMSHLTVLLTAAVLAGCTAPPAPEFPDTRAADEAALRSRIEAWDAAARAKDPEAFLAAYAADARLIIEDAPDMSGRDELLAGITGMMADPNFALSFAADEIVVARAGDMAYELGSYTMTISGADGQPATQTGHYVVVWRKEADGTWKAVVDAPVSDAPADGGGHAG